MRFSIWNLCGLVPLLTCLAGNVARAEPVGNSANFPILERYDSDCGPLTASGKVPPADYRIVKPEFRELVEKYHFHEHYAAYLAGKRMFQKRIDRIYESPAAGFDYTLWAFPNQHRALAAMEDMARHDQTERVKGSELRVDCYFQRAVRVAPDDALVRALYGYFYARRKMSAEAREQIKKAVELEVSDRNSFLYIATAYLEIGDLDAAAEFAKKAYAAGYSLPGLRERLKKAGRPLD